jgi:hypothetical protein
MPTTLYCVTSHKAVSFRVLELNKLWSCRTETVALNSSLKLGRIVVKRGGEEGDDDNDCGEKGRRRR